MKFKNRTWSLLRGWYMLLRELIYTTMAFLCNRKMNIGLALEHWSLLLKNMYVLLFVMIMALLREITLSAPLTQYAIYLFIYLRTGLWTQGLYLEPLLQPFLVLGIFEIGPCELFALVGFKPRSSWSLPRE
jgi:hypothetical protein